MLLDEATNLISNINYHKNNSVGLKREDYIVMCDIIGKGEE